MKKHNTSPFPSFALTSVLSVSLIHSMFYYEFSKDFHFRGEQHDFWEVIYVDKGECFVEVEDQHLLLNAGEAVLLRPNRFHRLGGNGKQIFNLFIISFTCKSNAMEAMPVDSFEVSTSMRDTFSKIIKEGRRAFYLPILEPSVQELAPRENALLGSRQLVKLYLEELLITILRMQSAHPDSGPVLSMLAAKIADPKNLTEAVEKYLLDNLDKPLSIATVCETFHYSKNYICSHFKQNTGYSIMEYFNRAKIERAKDLIREQNHSLSAISELLGFSSPGYFSKTFKRITGMSPLEYQRSLRLLLG